MPEKLDIWFGAGWSCSLKDVFDRSSGQNGMRCVNRDGGVTAVADVDDNTPSLC